MDRQMMPLPRERAEEVALAAFGWLATDEDLVGTFLGAAGMGVDDLRGAAGDPAFLGAVLDFILSDDATVMACAAALGLSPDQPMRARAALPGGDVPHWT